MKQGELGRSFASGLIAHGPFIVQTTSLGMGPLADGSSAVQATLAVLARQVAGAGLGPLRPTRVWSSANRVEAGIFVDQGWFEGAGLTAICPLMTSEVTVHVVRSSRLLRAGVWLTLGVGVGLGMAGAMALPQGWDPQLRLALGLLGGVGLGVGLMALLPRLGLANGAASSAVAAQLEPMARALAQP